MHEVAPPRRPPGRPRSPEADSAILRATLELLSEVGYSSLSLDQIRVRAGVGKATIYRRYRSLGELVKAAINQLSFEPVTPDTGHLLGDLAVISDASTENAEGSDGGELWLRLLAEAATEPELNAICYARLIEPSRAVLRTVLRRAAERGEVRADIDPEIAIDLLVGAQVYRLLIGGMNVEAVRARERDVLKTLLDGIAAEAP